MKYLLPLIFLMSGCASVKVGPQEDGSVMAHIPKEIVQQCESDGGCALVSESMLKEYAIQFALQMCGKGI